MEVHDVVMGMCTKALFQSLCGVKMAQPLYRVSTRHTAASCRKKLLFHTYFPPQAFNIVL